MPAPERPARDWKVGIFIPSPRCLEKGEEGLDTQSVAKHVPAAEAQGSPSGAGFGGVPGGDPTHSFSGGSMAAVCETSL